MASGIRVLHVDDDQQFADLSATCLENERPEITVVSVTSAGEGLDRLATEQFDCIVSDYEMPGRNGIEFLEAVREEHSDLPFILFTGKGSEEIASEAISAGVTDYLQKEAGTDQYAILANRIANCVDASRSAAEADQRRHRLEQILKTVPGCVVQLDADGQFVYANRRAEEVLGLTQAEVTDRAYNDPEWNIRDLDGDPIPEEELPFRRVRETGEPLYDFRHSIEWPDGTRKMLLVSGAPLFDEAGDVESVVFSLTDITDQYERRQELREAERRLQLALEATDTGVWEWDLETDAVFWNETLERAMGLEPGEFEGTYDAFVERVHPEDLEDVGAEIEAALETDGDYEAEFRMFDADGDVRWVRVRGRVVAARDGDGQRMVGVHHDITARREEEQRSQRQQARLQALFDRSPDMINTHDADGTIKDVNQRFVEQTGYDEDELVGMKVWDIDTSITAAEAKAAWREMDAADRLQTEGRFERRDGSTFPAEVHVRRLDVEDEAVFAVISHDITERKERERELREVTNQLEAVIDTVDAAIFLKDLDGRYQLFNETAREILGLDPETDVVGRTNDELFDEARAEQFTADDREVIETGEPVRREETIPHEDGERTHLTIKSPVYDESGELTGICAVSTDISDQVAARAELERQNERLGEFASVVSHDLRNPLRLATSRLELAMEECDSQHLAPIDDALERMDDIVENVLQLAREGRDIGTTEAVGLGDVARTAWTMTASDADGATLDVRTDGDRHVEADADRLRQLLENLFRNAIEHGGPEVTVTVGDLDDGFYVADTGPGIPADMREEVFEMGYSSTETGTGFGLSIVEQIVDAHGWDVHVTESGDGGAKFEVRNVEGPS